MANNKEKQKHFKIWVEWDGGDNTEFYLRSKEDLDQFLHTVMEGVAIWWQFGNRVFCLDKIRHIHFTEEWL